MKKYLVVVVMAFSVILCPSMVLAEETYTFTEDELYDYVYEQVHEDPAAYDVVSMDDYSDLEDDQNRSEEYEKTSAPSDTPDVYDVFTLILIGVAIAGISYHIGTKKSK